MARRKKKKIRWSGVALLAVIFAAIIFGIYMLVSLVVGWISGSKEGEPINIEFVDGDFVNGEETLERDSIVDGRIAKLIRQSVRLDSTVLALSVYDVEAERYVSEYNGRMPLIPASCMKIATAVGALELLGDDYVYSSSVWARGTMVGDTLCGELQLRVTDDPLLTSFDTLVHQIRENGIAAVRGSISFDLEREDTLNSHPSTMSWDITYGKVPLPMRGKAHIESSFRYALSQSDIAFKKDSVDLPDDYGSFMAPEWRIVALHETRLQDVLTPMLIHSSNVKAEAVLYHADRHAGLLEDKRMAWDITHAIHKFWEEKLAGRDSVDMQSLAMLDGSGLSPKNRLSTRTLVEVLRYAWNKESLRNYLIDEGLASPGHATRHGSLKGRMSAQKYHDRIFVKTGTMTTAGVSSLSGYIHASNDKWYIFSIINNDAPVGEGRLFQDEFCKIFMEL